MEKTVVILGDKYTKVVHSDPTVKVIVLNEERIRQDILHFINQKLKTKEVEIWHLETVQKHFLEKIQKEAEKGKEYYSKHLDDYFKSVRLKLVFE